MKRDAYQTPSSLSVELTVRECVLGGGSPVTQEAINELIDHPTWDSED